MVAERNFFLDTIGKHFSKQRPDIPEGLNYTVHIEATPESAFCNINLRSRGCRHNFLGGCTMCDYWVSRELDPARIIDFAREAINSLDRTPDMLCVGPYGSMFDEWEVPAPVRREIYQLMRSVKSSFYATFTRFDTVTEDKVKELAEHFEPGTISLDLGLETADPWKLKYCVNKALNLEQVAAALELLKRYQIFTTTYILLGVPFLSTAEMVQDTVSSVLWSLDHSVNYAVIFTVHIKPWTVVRWLYEHQSYEPVSLWALVEVLTQLPPELLGRVGLSWHNPRPERTHPLSTAPTLEPTTCPACYERVVPLLESYRFSQDRAETVRQVASIECACREEWRQKYAAKPIQPLAERVRNTYQQMGIDVLGETWWDQHGHDVLSSVPDYP